MCGMGRKSWNRAAAGGGARYGRPPPAAGGAEAAAGRLRALRSGEGGLLAAEDREMRNREGDQAAREEFTRGKQCPEG